MIDCPFTRRFDEIKDFHQICIESVKTGYYELAFEKACKIKYQLQTSLNEIDTLIDTLRAKIESEDNEPKLFDKEELITSQIWSD